MYSKLDRKKVRAEPLMKTHKATHPDTRGQNRWRRQKRSLQKSTRERRHPACDEEAPPPSSPRRERASSRESEAERGRERERERFFRRSG
jgi:hypothetical protein